MITERHHPHPRHAELVSASMPQIPPMALNKAWTLKQVQGDEVGTATLRVFAPSREPAFLFFTQSREAEKKKGIVG